MENLNVDWYKLRDQVSDGNTSPFFRGMLDSSKGNITFHNNKPKIILTGERAMCQIFSDFCKDFCDVKGETQRLRKNKYRYILRDLDTIPVLKALYNNSKVHLDRKYELAMKILSTFDN